MKLPPPPLANGDGKPPSWLKLISVMSVAFRHCKPTWRNYISYVDIAARNGDLAMARYRDTFRSLTAASQRSVLPEQVCELSGVTPGELIGGVCKAIWDTKGPESSMVSAIAHPEVLMITAKLAMKPDHQRDRELFFRLTGSLPDKKGSSINIYNQASSNEVKLDLQPNRPRLKSIDEEVIEMSKALDPPGAPFLVREEESSEQRLDE